MGHTPIRLSVSNPLSIRRYHPLMPVDFDAVRRAEAVLRPGAGDAIAAWRALVAAEREQVESLPNRPRPEDFYAPVAQAFRDDPHRKDDPLLELLRPLVRPDETWLDLGA